MCAHIRVGLGRNLALSVVVDSRQRRRRQQRRHVVDSSDVVDSDAERATSSTAATSYFLEDGTTLSTSIFVFQSQRKSMWYFERMANRRRQQRLRLSAHSAKEDVNKQGPTEIYYSICIALSCTLQPVAKLNVRAHKSQECKVLVSDTYHPIQS